jgi:superfamily I DNA/RNA helicase
MTEPQQGVFAADRLDQYQRAAATAREPVVAVTGGPGAGKTRTLLGRLGFLLAGGMDPQSVVLVTSTQGAVEDLRRRWRADLGMATGPDFRIGTPLELAYTVLRSCAESIGLQPPDTVWDLDQARQVLCLLTGDWLGREMGPREAMEVLWWARGPVAMPCREEPDWAEVVEQCNDLKRQQGVMGVDDLVPAAIGVLQDMTRRDLRWPQLQWDHMVIDNLEDMTAQDWQLLKMLARPGGSLTVGINLNERVRGMRGADDGVWAALRMGDAVWPAAQIYELGLNHHGNGSVYALSRLLRQSDRSNWSADEVDGFPLGPQVTGSELVIVRGTRSEMDQVVLQQMSARISQGRRWDEMACISYGRASLQRFRDTLVRHQIPHNLLSASPGRGEDPLKESALALLQLVANPRDLGALTVWLGSVYRARQVGTRVGLVVARHVHDLAREHEGDLGEALSHETRRHRAAGPIGICLAVASMAYQDLCRVVDEGTLERSEAWSRAQGLVAMALVGGARPEQSNGDARSGTPVTRQWLADALCSLAAMDWSNVPDPQGLTLATVNEAKGLHWPLVWVLDGSEDEFPDFAESDLPQRREWIPRAFYVAATRALEQAHIYCSQMPGRGVDTIILPDPDAMDDGIISKRYVNARGEETQLGQD